MSSSFGCCTYQFFDQCTELIKLSILNDFLINVPRWLDYVNMVRGKHLHGQIKYWHNIKRRKPLSFPKWFPWKPLSVDLCRQLAKIGYSYSFFSSKWISNLRFSHVDIVKIWEQCKIFPNNKRDIMLKKIMLSLLLRDKK